MAIIQEEYTGNIEDLDKAHDFQIVPAGDYIALISGEREKFDTESGKLVLTFQVQIVEGEYKSNIIWDDFYLKNYSQAAEQRALIRLARISTIINGSRSYNRDTKNLHNKILRITVDTEGYTDRFGKSVTKNVIKQYHPKNCEFKDLPAVSGKKSVMPNINNDNAQVVNDEIPF